MELTLDRLNKKFGDKIAVNNVTAVFTNGIYGLLGANGAGKTTLMRMICDVVTPTSGKILADGERADKLGENYRKLLGYLPQNFGYYPDYTAKEFMYYIAALKGIPKRQAKHQAKQLLELVSLSTVADKKIKTFSGGMKQRLGIAQAILGNPKILILDEPTAGLDPRERVRFRNLIADFAQDKIVLLSTHIVSDVEHIADDIIIMKNGKFILSAPAGEIVHEMDGKVWECSFPNEKADEICSRHCVANLHHGKDGRVFMRLISGKKPSSNAVLAEPSLEDLYLYHFQNSKGGRRK